MSERREQIQQRGRDLIELVERRLPLEFDVPTMWDGWPAIGVGLLTRMATTLRSMLDLQRSELEADASILGRSLYEHGVYFAWLAAEPDKRVLLWRRADYTQRLKLDDDVKRYGGPALTPENRKKVESNLEDLGGRLTLHTDQLADLADHAWLERIRAIIDPDENAKEETASFSYRWLYGWLFRGYSSISHPSEVGLFRVTDELGGGRFRVRLEHSEPERTHNPYGMATVLMGLTLFVASQSIGWPPTSKVHDIFER